MTAADNIHKYFFYCFSEKIRLDVSSESSVRQRIHMKNQALFSSKGKSEKKIKMSSALIGTLWVNCCTFLRVLGCFLFTASSFCYVVLLTKILVKILPFLRLSDHFDCCCCCCVIVYVHGKHL